MAHSIGASAREDRLPLTNPWPCLAGAFGVMALALVLHSAAVQVTIVRAWLIAVGVLLGLGAVGIRLRSAREDVDNRFTTAGILALAAGVPLLGALALNPEWDSASILLWVLVSVALTSAFLILLPRLLRRLILVALVIFHFGGIMSSVGSPAPPNGQASWLANQLWVAVYRPYLHFMYLNNAYHFYSPDPGPPILLWFRISYADTNGKEVRSHWVTVPNPNEQRMALTFQRQLALTESTNQLRQQPPMDFEERRNIRIQAGAHFRPNPIPMLDPPGVPRNFEYRDPIPFSKQMLRSYARYVAERYPWENVATHDQWVENPALKVQSIKIYRVIHSIPTPAQIAQGLSPYDPTMYLPYYQGKFDAQGNLLDGPRFEDCRLVDRGDPFLYWLIPIRREPKPGVSVPKTLDDWQIVDYLKIHAGDADKPSFWER